MKNNKDVSIQLMFLDKTEKMKQFKIIFIVHVGYYFISKKQLNKGKTYLWHS